MNENICGYQKCTVRSLIQSTVAVWFDAPYDATNSEFRLISMYKNQVFSDNHKEICYYASASLFFAFDKLIYENRIDSSWRSAKPFVCYLVKRSIAQNKVSLNDTERAETVAKDILKLLKNTNNALDEFEKALNVFAKAKELFKQQNNKNMNNYLSSHKVMSYLLGAMDKLNESKSKHVEKKQEETVETFSGKIIRIGRDRNGCSYMFITRGDNSIFAHQNFSDDCNFSNLQTGKTVIYELSTDNYGREVAVNVRK